jgi:endonuclease YncB( thermonuclease family)
VAKRIAARAGERCLACAHAAPASLQRTALGVEALVALRDVSESTVAVHGPWDSPPGEAPPPLAGCTSRRARPVSGDTADRFAATWRGRRTGRSRAPSRGTRAPTRGRTAARGAGSARSAPSARGRGPAGPWTKAGRSHPHGPQASATTKAMLPPGTRVRLFPEPATDSVDQYGRLLRYVVRAEDGLNVNVQLVRVGAAAPYFYEGRRGRYASLLERFTLRARATKLGLWGRCPHTQYDPTRGVSTMRGSSSWASPRRRPGADSRRARLPPGRPRPRRASGERRARSRSRRRARAQDEHRARPEHRQTRTAKPAASMLRPTPNQLLLQLP